MSETLSRLRRSAALRPNNLQIVRAIAITLCMLFIAAAWITLAHHTDAQTSATKGDIAPTTPDCGPNWLVVNSPNVGTGSNSLYGMDGASGSDLWAVGNYLNTSTNKQQTLIEHGNGSQWAVVPSASTGTDNNYLKGVAALSSNTVWAVGYYNNGTANRTLIEFWNGNHWSGTSSPNVGSLNNALHAVAVYSSNNAWAVGQYFSNGVGYRTLIEHWDGTSWSVSASPNNTSYPNNLTGISIVSANNIWAVGHYNNGTAERTLTLHWDGSNWFDVASPNAGTDTNNYLYSVKAVSANDVWAVGRYIHTILAKYQTLILHYDGTSWAIITSPNASTSHNYLFSVDSASTNDVWTAGYYYDLATNKFRTLTEHWNGTAWSVVPSPISGTGSNYLYGIAVSSSTDVSAVGYHDESGTNKTLAERYNPCVGTPSPTNVPRHTDTPTSAPTNTRTPLPTQTPGGSTATPIPTNTRTSTPTPAPPTATPTAIPTECSIQFEDVQPGSPFYAYARCLACRGIMGGYPCGGPDFPCIPPNNYPYLRVSSNITRGQLSKMVSNAAGFNDLTTTQTFQDVPVGSTFFPFIGRLASRGFINGYDCGGAGEPCVNPNNLDYFRPGNTATRGQASKIISKSAGFSEPPGNQLFQDVPSGSGFFPYIQRLGNRGIVSGYNCGYVESEPCVLPGNLPYFHPVDTTTRGQIAKIIANTFFPNCSTPLGGNKR